MNHPDNDVDARLSKLAPTISTAERLSPGIGGPAAAQALLTGPASSADEPSARAVPLARRRRRIRRPVVSIVAASVLGLAAAGISVVMPADTPGAPPAAAADEIRQMAVVAASTPSHELSDGEFLHLVDESAQDGSDPSFHKPLDPRKSWVAADGSMWVRLGWIHLDDAIRIPAPRKPSLSEPTPAFLATLPTDPVELREQVREHVGDHVRGAWTVDRRMFEAVGDMLRPGYTSPELRAAAFTVLAGLPGVEVHHDTRLNSGRTGTAVVLTSHHRDGVTTETLIFDSVTTAYLGESSGSEGMHDGEPAWSNYWSERLASEVVDAVPDDVRTDARTGATS